MYTAAPLPVTPPVTPVTGGIFAPPRGQVHPAAVKIGVTAEIAVVEICIETVAEGTAEGDCSTRGHHSICCTTSSSSHGASTGHRSLSIQAVRYAYSCVHMMF